MDDGLLPLTLDGKGLPEMTTPCSELERIIKTEEAVKQLIPMVAKIDEKLDAALARESNMKGFLAGAIAVTGAIFTIAAFVAKAIPAALSSVIK